MPRFPVCAIMVCEKRERGGSVITGKKTVALTGGSGTMGFQGFLELYSHAEEFDIRLLLRDSQKNRKKFAKYMDDPAVKIVWGDLTKYADVLELVTGAAWCPRRRTTIPFPPSKPT